MIIKQNTSKDYIGETITVQVENEDGKIEVWIKDPAFNSSIIGITSQQAQELYDVLASVVIDLREAKNDK